MIFITASYHFAQESFQIEAPSRLIPSIEAAIRSTVPNARFGAGKRLVVEVDWEDGLRAQAAFGGEPPFSLTDREILAVGYSEMDRQRREKERVRLIVQRALEAIFHLAANPWGILMGVRPTKLVHSLVDRGVSPTELQKMLSGVYGLAPEKIELLREVTKRQRAFFHPRPNQPISIYVGIPFCPTRCSYCSFAAYPLKTHGHLLDGFLEALYGEIEAVGKLLRELKVDVQSVYLGGGTPTTVQGRRLEKLLALTRQHLIRGQTQELTVEAGRPETLTLEALRILKDFRVDRISINPQSMHEQTLQAIGRDHSVAEIKSAYEKARAVGIPAINMDIILGLPGETVVHVRQTLEEIEALQPDNLTVHGLAIKRASRLKKDMGQVQKAQREGKKMADLAQEYARKWGMKPYYLYRQRHILSGLENIGYALAGLESVYNIQMMEERQTILALGGGGITKLVAPDLSLVRLVNPKCPATYTQQLKGSLKAKIMQIYQHLTV